MVKVRKRKNRGYWEVDLRVVMPNGRTERERWRSPIQTKAGAFRWGIERERMLLDGTATLRRLQKEVPLLREFGKKFLVDYAEANRQKPSGIAAKETILRVHLIPLLGNKRLDQITNRDVAELKKKLNGKEPKTANNVLSVLKTLLQFATDQGVIREPSCTVRLVPFDKRSNILKDCYSSEEYESLVQAARSQDPRAHLICLLGGEAGLRCGEMMALEWGDVDFRKRQLWVRRSEWKGEVRGPKGGKERWVPLASRLASALKAMRQPTGRVLRRDDGRSVTQKIVQGHVARAAKLAGLKRGGVHRLRHRFGSELAERGVPALDIKTLMGHMSLETTERYMHASPEAIKRAIKFVENPSAGTFWHPGGTEESAPPVTVSN